MTITFDEAIERRTCAECKRTISIDVTRHDDAPPYVCAECLGGAPTARNPVASSADHERAKTRFPIPSGQRARACNGCGAAIYFHQTEAGKWLPIDPTGEPHWASCPAAANFRRRR